MGRDDASTIHATILGDYVLDDLHVLRDVIGYDLPDRLSAGLVGKEASVDSIDRRREDRVKPCLIDHDPESQHVSGLPAAHSS